MLRQTRYRFPRARYDEPKRPVSLRSGGFMVEAERASTYEVTFTTVMVGQRYSFMGKMEGEQYFLSTRTSSAVAEIRLLAKDGGYSPLTGTDYSVEDYLLKHGGKLAIVTKNNVYEIEVCD